MAGLDLVTRPAASHRGVSKIDFGATGRLVTIGAPARAIVEVRETQEAARNLFADQRRQILCTLAEVNRLRRHQHSNRARRLNHAPAFKARSTAATVFASAPRPIRMLTPSISTSMLPAVRSPLGFRWCFRLVKAVMVTPFPQQPVQTAAACCPGSPVLVGAR